MENQGVGQTPKLDRAPFQMGVGQVYTMMAPPSDTLGGGYDSSGINPGGLGGGGVRPPVLTTPTTQAPAPSTPAPAPAQTPSTPAAPNLGPTAQNPLAPLNNYQAQQATGSYHAPAFQGGSSYQAGSYQAP